MSALGYRPLAGRFILIRAWARCCRRSQGPCLLRLINVILVGPVRRAAAALPSGQLQTKHAARVRAAKRQEVHDKPSS